MQGELGPSGGASRLRRRGPGDPQPVVGPPDTASSKNFNSPIITNVKWPELVVVYPDPDPTNFLPNKIQFLPSVIEVNMSNILILWSINTARRVQLWINFKP